MPAEITLNSRVRTVDDLLFQELQGEAVILNLESGVYFGLNPMGTKVWHLIQEDGDLSHVLEALLRDYDVTRETLERDLLDVVARMQQKGLLAEAN